MQVLEPAEVAIDAGDHAVVTGHLGVAAAITGIGSKRLDVAELSLERRLELG